MFARIDHVSIGVLDMEKARRLFCDVLGGEPLPDAGTSEPEGFDWMTFMLGGRKMELVTPHVHGEGGVGRYVEKHGEGFHHICCMVEDVPAAIGALRVPRDQDSRGRRPPLFLPASPRHLRCADPGRRGDPGHPRPRRALKSMLGACP